MNIIASIAMLLKDNHFSISHEGHGRELVNYDYLKINNYKNLLFLSYFASEGTIELAEETGPHSYTIIFSTLLSTPDAIDKLLAFLSIKYKAEHDYRTDN